MLSEWRLSRKSIRTLEPLICFEPKHDYAVRNLHIIQSKMSLIKIWALTLWIEDLLDHKIVYKNCITPLKL